MKDKLVSEVQHRYARQECYIHSRLKHENIVELYDYTEDDSQFVLLMEYINDASYFEDKLENVSAPHNSCINYNLISKEFLIKIFSKFGNFLNFLYKMVPSDHLN